MNESQALAVAAVRVIESADGDHLAWSDDDRAWASHAAASVVGEAAAPDQFLAQRASHALGRLQSRHAGLRRAIDALGWRPWVAWLIVVGAFLLGLLADRVGDAQRINVLAPPVLLLLLWNLAVYLVIAVARLLPVAGRDMRRIRCARRSHAWARAGTGRGRSWRTPVASWMASLAREWARLAAPLYQARAARVLHLAAAALAAGVIAGLYMRGLAFEYRATWESTFLDSATVHAVLSVVLAPGAWLGGLPVPDLAEVSAIRAPRIQERRCVAASDRADTVGHGGAAAAGAGRLRMVAASAGAPPICRCRSTIRISGACCVASTSSRRRSWCCPTASRRPRASVAGLEVLLARLLGGAASIHLVAPIGYGEEDDPALRKLPAQAGPVVVLFNLAATPEREAHAAFARRLEGRLRGRATLAGDRRRDQFQGPRRRRRAAPGADGDRPGRTCSARCMSRPPSSPCREPDLPAADAALDLALNRPET